MTAVTSYAITLIRYDSLHSLLALPSVHGGRDKGTDPSMGEFQLRLTSQAAGRLATKAIAQFPECVDSRTGCVQWLDNLSLSLEVSLAGPDEKSAIGASVSLADTCQENSVCPL
jgi:hypothetical protein